MPDPFNVNDFVVNQGNGVKGLADLGIDTIPKPYIQTLQEQFNSTKTNTQYSIPIIDFSKSDDPEVVEAIFEATAKWGFFQIVNHGVPIEILEDLKAVVHRVFEFPPFMTPDILYEKWWIIY